jgi:hypothetical protein
VWRCRVLQSPSRPTWDLFGRPHMGKRTDVLQPVHLREQRGEDSLRCVVSASACVPRLRTDDVGRSHNTETTDWIGNDVIALHPHASNTKAQHSHACEQYAMAHTTSCRKPLTMQRVQAAPKEGNHVLLLGEVNTGWEAQGVA